MPLIRSLPRFLCTPKPRPGARCWPVLGLALFLAACVSNPPAPPAPVLPERPVAPTADLAFAEGIAYAVDDLLVQARRLPAFQTPATAASATAARPVIALDATLDAASGLPTQATRLLDARLLERAAAGFSSFEVVPVSPAQLQRARFVLAGSLAEVPDTASGTRRIRINLSLSDLRSGFVVAQSVARVLAADVDTTPTRIARDSPSLTRDRIAEGHIRTSQTAAGAEADALYLERLPVAALVNEAVRFYEAGQFDQALRFYQAASERADGQQLRVLNGLYLSHQQLGQTEAAEAAFRRIVALGLATNALSVKFLFRPASTEFLPDPGISAPYNLWVRAIGREAVAAGVCLSLVGHTSRTGSEMVNDRLSLQRAQAMLRRLEQAAPELRGRLQASGVGFRENLVGSGTDDLRDALDRRVDFRVVAC